MLCLLLLCLALYEPADRRLAGKKNSIILLDTFFDFTTIPKRCEKKFSNLTSLCGRATSLIGRVVGVMEMEGRTMYWEDVRGKSNKTCTRDRTAFLYIASMKNSYRRNHKFRMFGIVGLLGRLVDFSLILQLDGLFSVSSPSSPRRHFLPISSRRDTLRIASLLRL